MMPKLSFVFLSILISSVSAATTNGKKSEQLYLDGKKLPDDFLYGCGTSAYQIEGATGDDAEGGKGASVWDTFAHDTGKGHIFGDVNGDVAMDFYHTYPQDLPLFRSALGVGLYDFTIAWTRWFPNGTESEPLEAGVKFYKDMIKETHKNDMLASCTLYHWDIPQGLEDKYNGWLSKDVVTDFTKYANAVYDKLGKDCDIWVTMNEPRTFCVEGYGPDTDSAPGREGPIDDTYTCFHHAMLAHASAVKAFNEKKKAGVVKGKIGIKLDGSPAFALNSSDPTHQAVTERAMDFEMGWGAAPIWSGDYPQVMRDTMGDHLPTFTEEEKKLLNETGSDFLAYDAYTSQWVSPLNETESCNYGDDLWPTCVNSYTEDPITQKLIGRPTKSPWNFQANDTIFTGSKYFVERWGVKDIRVGENGLAVRNDSQLPMNQIVDDIDRIDWYRQALKNVKWGLDYGLPITGWIPWSCISNLEWSSGYVNDFGLIHTLPGKNQTRTPKLSTAYMKSVFLKGAKIDPYNFEL